jgi:hypothetical protein
LQSPFMGSDTLGERRSKTSGGVQSFAFSRDSKYRPSIPR